MVHWVTDIHGALPSSHTAGASTCNMLSAHVAVDLSTLRISGEPGAIEVVSPPCFQQLASRLQIHPKPAEEFCECALVTLDLIKIDGSCVFVWCPTRKTVPISSQHLLMSALLTHYSYRGHKQTTCPIPNRGKLAYNTKYLVLEKIRS